MKSKSINNQNYVIERFAVGGQELQQYDKEVYINIYFYMDDIQKNKIKKEKRKYEVKIFAFSIQKGQNQSKLPTKAQPKYTYIYICRQLMFLFREILACWRIK